MLARYGRPQRIHTNAVLPMTDRAGLSLVDRRAYGAARGNRIAANAGEIGRNILNILV